MTLLLQKKGHPITDAFHNCHGRLIGKLVECLTRKKDCPWISSYGHTGFCLHKNANIFSVNTNQLKAINAISADSLGLNVGQ